MTIAIKRRQTRYRIAAIVLAATWCLGLTSSRAQPVAPARCSHNADAAVNLELVRAADNDKTRAVAASSLIKEWPTTLPTVMRELAKNSGPTDRWPADQSSYFLSVTDILRTVLSTNVDAISLFRMCDDVSIIKPLIWAARGQNQAMRLNATLILGNTVDNTTVCYVLHHLRDPSISANGRANLLGVTFAVAGYAYLENSREIQKTLDGLKSRIEPEMAQTQKLIADVSTRANANSNKLTPMAQAGLAGACASYDYSPPPD